MRRVLLTALAALSLAAYTAEAAPLSRVTLTVNCGGVPWQYTAGIGFEATDGYDPQDVPAPPSAPFLEVRLLSSGPGGYRMTDMRDGAGCSEVWEPLTVIAHNIPQQWSASVKLTWDLAAANGWSYKLRDLTSSIDIPLLPGGSYTFRIDGPNGPTMRLEAVIPETPISTAKLQPDDISARFGGTVTAVFPIAGPQELFYVEDDHRTAGIRVISAVPVGPGDGVRVGGVVGESEGERVISAFDIDRYRVGGDVPWPLVLSNSSLCGGAFGLQAAVVDRAAEGLYAVGLSNVGVLVTTTGSLTYSDTGGAFFYIDDGSGLSDGSGHIGVRVSCAGLAAPVGPCYLSVTGIAGTAVVGSRVVRCLRPRSQGDILEISGGVER